MKRKKQPSAEAYREQLRLAADEIIRLRQWKFWYESMARPSPWKPLEWSVDHSQNPWWQQWKRLFRKSA